MFTIVVVIGCYASFVVSWNGLMAKTNLYLVEKDVAATRLNGLAKAMGLGFITLPSQHQRPANLLNSCGVDRLRRDSPDPKASNG